MRRIPFNRRKHVFEKLQEQVDLDVIERVTEPSQWFNLLVEKKTKNKKKKTKTKIKTMEEKETTDYISRIINDPVAQALSPQEVVEALKDYHTLSKTRQAISTNDRTCFKGIIFQAVKDVVQTDRW